MDECAAMIAEFGNSRVVQASGVDRSEDFSVNAL
jgi:hypothetical protein